MLHSKNQLFEILQKLSPVKFAEVVMRYGLDRSYLSTDKPQIIQAIELLQDVESSEKNLVRLAAAIQVCLSLSPSKNITIPIGLGAYRHCNREDQDNHFRLLFDQGCQLAQGEPQFYLSHGEEGECHRHFIQRLCETHIQNYAERVFGLQRADVFVLHPAWSDRTPDMAEQYLNFNLLSALREKDGESIDSTNLTDTLTQLLLRRVGSVVVLCYDLAAQHWRKNTPVLLQRYCVACRTAYQKAQQIHSQAAHCLVFINLVYPSTEQKQHFSLWERFTYSSKRIEQAVQMWQQNLIVEHRYQMIEKLTSVTWLQAKTCLQKLGLHEEACLQRLNTIFGTKKQARMAVVEAELIKLIQQLQQDAL